MDQRTLAFINLYGVLGSLEELCRLDPEAKKLIAGKDVSIGFAVKGGPEATLTFKNGECKISDGVDNCAIKLPFPSPEKFNLLIDGKYTPIPSKGFTKIKFLTGEFTKLTDLLPVYLRADPERLKSDPAFFDASTRIMFKVIVRAIAQIGNEDPVGKFSAGNIIDGNIVLNIANGGPTAYIAARNHHLTAVFEETDKVMSRMEFDNIELARALFDGNINAYLAVGTGGVRMSGMISQVNSLNRILDRVAMYLA